MSKPTGATCSGPECDRQTSAQGLCTAHYAQKRKGKGLVPLRSYRKGIADFADADPQAPAEPTGSRASFGLSPLIPRHEPGDCCVECGCEDLHCLLWALYPDFETDEEVSTCNPIGEKLGWVCLCCLTTYEGKESTRHSCPECKDASFQ